MRYLSLLAVLLSALVLRAQTDPPNNGYPNGQEFNPWSSAPVVVCYQGTYFLPGVPPVVVKPEGMTVFLSASVQPGSGYHTHTGPPPRPIGTMTPNFAQTGPDGCASFRFQNSGYAGWVTFTAVADRPEYNKPFYKGFNNHFVYRDHNLQGQAVPLSNLANVAQISDITQYFGYHVDSRHKDKVGNTGQQRFATLNSIEMLALLAYVFKFDYPQYNPNQNMFDITRGGLGEAGIHDCFLGANIGTGCQFGEYDPSLPPAEQHNGAVEWDVVNPTLETGDNGTLYGLLAQLTTRSGGCTLGKTDQYSNQLPANGIISYWAIQPVVHIVCSARGKKVM